MSARAEVLEEGLSNLARWWPGHWSNAVQVSSPEQAALAPEQRHRRLDMVVVPVSLPAFGDLVFYAEIFADGDPQKIVRQRLYAASIDRGRAVLRVRLFIFADAPRRFPRAYENPAILASLASSDLTVIEGCDLLLQPEPDGLMGGMDFGACRYEAFPALKAEGIAEVISHTRMVIGPDRFWNSDALYDSASRARVGQVRAGGTFTRFTRGRGP